MLNLFRKNKQLELEDEYNFENRPSDKIKITGCLITIFLILLGIVGVIHYRKDIREIVNRSNNIISNIKKDNIFQLEEEAENDDLKKDTDNDGLTNKVEELYGTKIDKHDSDNDGYSDYQEIFNGYNPLGGGKLEEKDRNKPLYIINFEEYKENRKTYKDYTFFSNDGKRVAFVYTTCLSKFACLILEKGIIEDNLKICKNTKELSSEHKRCKDENYVKFLDEKFIKIQEEIDKIIESKFNLEKTEKAIEGTSPYFNNNDSCYDEDGNLKNSQGCKKLGAFWDKLGESIKYYNDEETKNIKQYIISEGYKSAMYDKACGFEDGSGSFTPFANYNNTKGIVGIIFSNDNQKLVFITCSADKIEYKGSYYETMPIFTAVMDNNSSSGKYGKIIDIQFIPGSNDLIYIGNEKIVGNSLVDVYSSLVINNREYKTLPVDFNKYKRQAPYKIDYLHRLSVSPDGKEIKVLVTIDKEEQEIPIYIPR